MQRYQVVVNGNTYTVTVKNIVGGTAVVDVDGWEFQVAIDESDETGGLDMAPLIAAAGASAGTKAPPPPTPVPAKPDGPPAVGNAGRKRSSALEELGPKKGSTPEISGKGVVSAHLPGQIIEISVKVGDAVSKGQLVGKMEAMKMVNDVVATIDGTVKEILIAPQQNVLENQPLIIIE